MTSPARAATVLFSDAATAARVTERQLRNWLDRQQFRPLGDAGREDGRWRRFAPVDVVRLAVFGRLVANGCTVAEAGDIISIYIDPIFSLWAYKNPLDATASWPPTYHAQLKLHHSDDGPQIKVGFFDPDPTDFVILSVDAIARQAIGKIEEIAAGASADDPADG